MRNTLIIAAAALVVSFGLTACGGETPDPSSTTTPSASPIAVSATTPTAPVQPPSSAPAVVPITFDCGDLSLYQSGTALYSAGTTGNEASCDTYVPPVVTQAPTRVLQYCDYPGAAVYTDGTYSATDPACAEMRAESSVDQNPNPGGGYPYDPEETAMVTAS